ncbi:hypothetical protein [Streptococcus dysgalactiae]|uniref:hypothetical protein n=1 Tax=Streptococcus dysgalactiae TaxID=1334 RepID=UPI0039F4D4B5
MMHIQLCRDSMHYMMINYFAMQIEFGWITLEDVPKKYREKVKQLIESGNIGAE